MSLAKVSVFDSSSPEDQSLAQSLTEAFERFGKPLPPVSLVGEGLDCPLPPTAAAQLVGMLQMMAEGVPVEVVPAVSELTVHQAAKYLGDPEGYVNELLQDNQLEHRHDGDQIWIKRDSLVAFEQQSKKSRAALDELVRLSEEMGLYDD